MPTPATLTAAAATNSRRHLYRVAGWNSFRRERGTLGISVEELLAVVANETGVVSVNPDEIAELDRRWAKVEAGARTVPKVVRWLETWGTAEFRPWREQ